MAKLFIPASNCADPLIISRGETLGSGHDGLEASRIACQLPIKSQRGHDDEPDVVRVSSRRHTV